MSHALLIARFFPPIGGAGSQRPASFAKYLPDHDWRTTVLTGCSNGESSLFTHMDASLDSNYSNVIRAPDPSTAIHSESKAGPMLDSYEPWARSIWPVVREQIENERPDVVLITMSPFSLSHIAARIKQSSDIPVVVDLRDPWALDGWQLHRTKLRWRLHRRTMKRTLELADGVVANTPESSRRIAATFGSTIADKMTVVPNGFDGENFNKNVVRRSENSDSFRIVHAGTLHSRELYRNCGPLARPKRWVNFRAEPIIPSGRTLLHLVRAIVHLEEHGHDWAGDIHIRLVGVHDPATARFVRESPLSSRIESIGYRPHHESVDMLCGADALFLPLHGLPPGRRALIVPGKTYEYLAAGPPILGCLPPGDARDLVMKSGRGFCADPCTTVEIAQALSSLHESVVAGSVSRAEPDWLRQYERRVLAGRLAEFLNRVAGRQTATAMRSTSLGTGH